MTTLTKLAAITDADVAAAAARSDPDCIVAICDKAGIDTGDVAAQAFSGFDWTKATATEREVAVRHWLKLERLYADD